MSGYRGDADRERPCPGAPGFSKASDSIERFLGRLNLDTGAGRHHGTRARESTTPDRALQVVAAPGPFRSCRRSARMHRSALPRRATQSDSGGPGPNDRHERPAVERAVRGTVVVSPLKRGNATLERCAGAWRGLAGARADHPPRGDRAAEWPGRNLHPEQLEQVAAPIALYPDPLLAQLLMASDVPARGRPGAARFVKDNPTSQG